MLAPRAAVNQGGIQQQSLPHRVEEDLGPPRSWSPPFSFQEIRLSDRDGEGFGR